MSIYINKDTRVITQGITGKTGQYHTEKCQEYANGKNCFVAGVNPKKAGESIFNIPIYASVKEAAKETGDVEAVTQFYESDRQNRDQQVQQALMGAVVTRYRDDLKGRYGLREDQMIYLGENPEMMEARAQGLAQQNQQAQTFQQSLDNAFLGQQAHERTMMNADRIGGSRGGAGRPEPTYEKGSMDHLRELMYGDSQVLIP